MLKKLGNLKKRHQVFFSLVVLSGVVSLWRGIWGLSDLYLIPHDLTLSFTLSIVLGAAIIGVTHYTIDKLF